MSTFCCLFMLACYLSVLFLRYGHREVGFGLHCFNFCGSRRFDRRWFCPFGRHRPRNQEAKSRHSRRSLDARFRRWSEMRRYSRGLWWDERVFLKTRHWSFPIPTPSCHSPLLCFGKKSKNTFGFLRPTAEIDFPFFSWGVWESCCFLGAEWDYAWNW